MITYRVSCRVSETEPVKVTKWKSIKEAEAHMNGLTDFYEAWMEEFTRAGTPYMTAKLLARRIGPRHALLNEGKMEITTK